jgi:hypothetical protein
MARADAAVSDSVDLPIGRHRSVGGGRAGAGHAGDPRRAVGEVVEDPRADAGADGGAQGRRLGGGGNLHGSFEDVAHELGEEGVAREAAGHAKSRCAHPRRGFGLLEVGSQRKGEAFDERARQVSPARRVVGGAHVGEREVSDRQPELTGVHHLGAERGQHSHRAGCGGGRLCEELDDGMSRLRVQQPGDPGGRRSHGAGVALENPVAREDVMGGPQATFAVEDGPVQHQLHGGRRSRDDADLSGAHDAGAEESALGIPPADRHGNARAQTQVRRGALVQLSETGPGLANRGEEPARQVEPIDEVPGPVAGGEVEEQRLARLGGVAGELAAEAMGEPVAETQMRGGPLPAFRVLVGHPAQSTGGLDRIRPVAGAAVQFLAALSGEAEGLGQAAGVLIGRHEDLVSVRVEDCAGVPHAGRGDSRDPFGGGAGCIEGLPDAFAEEVPGAFRVELGGRREPWGLPELPGPEGRGGPPGFEVDDQAAGAAAAEVQPEEEFLAHVECSQCFASNGPTTVYLRAGRKCERSSE